MACETCARTLLYYVSIRGDLAWVSGSAIIQCVANPEIRSLKCIVCSTSTRPMSKLEAMLIASTQSENSVHMRPTILLLKLLSQFSLSHSLSLICYTTCNTSFGFAMNLFLMNVLMKFGLQTMQFCTRIFVWIVFHSNFFKLFFLKNVFFKKKNCKIYKLWYAVKKLSILCQIKFISKSTIFIITKLISNNLIFSKIFKCRIKTYFWKICLLIYYENNYEFWNVSIILLKLNITLYSVFYKIVL